MTNQRLAVFVLPILAFLPGQTPRPAGPTLERMEEVYQSLNTLRTEFTRVKSYPQLDMTDPPERGILYVKRVSGKDRMVRVEITEPEKRIVTVKNGRYLLYQPRIKQAIEGKLNGGGQGAGAGFVGYFLGDLSGARRDYEVTSMGEERLDDRQTVHLRLLLKKGGQGFYRQIDLWVDTSLWMPIRQELVEPNQSVNRIRFENIQVDIELEDGLFELDLPPGVERVHG